MIKVTPLWSAALVIVILLIWQFFIATYGLPGIPAKYLGSPFGIWIAFKQLLAHGYNGRSLWFNIGVSVLRVASGFLIGVALALPMGFLMGYSKIANNLVGPILNFLRPIPALAFVPVVIIWFGIGETGKIFVIAATAFLYTVLSVSAGVSTVPRDYLRAGANFNLSPLTTFRRIVLPASLPHIIVGLRTASAISWAVVVAAELIAAQHGLGYIIENASTFFQINTVYVGIIFIGIVGLAMDGFFQLLHKRYLHWL